MEMSKEEILERLEEIKKAEKIKTAELFQIKGIIADCNYWLEKIDEKAVKSSKKPANTNN